MGEYWALATTHPNCERRAALNLEWQGFSWYAPVCKRISYKGGIRHERIVFMFPGYIFIKVVDVWRSVLHTNGIARIVGGSSPCRVRAGVVEDLIAKEQDGTVPLPWSIGQILRVKCGALRGEL